MLIGIIAIWLITAIGLWIASLILPGIRIKSTTTLLKAALVLGLINAFIRPLKYKKNKSPSPENQRLY
ncbi:hypothetical protein MNBD_GAMMA25-2091 [hydrothermal vent metagenome]|uniref:Uncharacterized protein n=1 Tax=hydrothermal vent metagenome TaxID=652676 RepID=A0A3B1BDI9_9ZZZZ